MRFKQVQRFMYLFKRKKYFGVIGTLNRSSNNNNFFQVTCHLRYTVIVPPAETQRCKIPRTKEKR